MRKRFLRSLLVVLAAFGAMFLVVSPDEFRELDAAYIHTETLKEAAESVGGQRQQRAVYFSRLATPNRGRYSSRPAPLTPAPTLSAFSTCILRC